MKPEYTNVHYNFISCFYFWGIFLRAHTEVRVCSSLAGQYRLFILSSPVGLCQKLSSHGKSIIIFLLFKVEIVHSFLLTCLIKSEWSNRKYGEKP